MRSRTYPTSLRTWPGRQLLGLNQLFGLNQLSLFTGSPDKVEQKCCAYFSQLANQPTIDGAHPNIHLQLDGPLVKWGGHVWAALDVSVNPLHVHAERFNKYLREIWLPQHGAEVDQPFRLRIPEAINTELTVTLPQVLLWGAYWQYGYTTDCPLQQAFDRYCPAWRQQLGALWSRDEIDPSYHWAQQWLTDLGSESAKKHLSSRLYFNLLFVDQMAPARAIELMEWNIRMDEQPPAAVLLNRVMNSGIDLAMRLPKTAKLQLQDAILTVGHLLDAYYEGGNQNAKHWLKAFISQQIAPEPGAGNRSSCIPSL